MVDEILTEKGFSRMQIKELYKFRSHEINGLKERAFEEGYSIYYDNYNKDTPYLIMLIDNIENEKRENLRDLDIPLPEMWAE